MRGRSVPVGYAQFGRVRLAPREATSATVHEHWPSHWLTSPVAVGYGQAAGGGGRSRPQTNSPPNRVAGRLCSLFNPSGAVEDLTRSAVRRFMRRAISVTTERTP